MKFIIEGALMQDAHDITTAVEADTQEQARQIARTKGIFVSSIERSNTVQILPHTIKGASIRSCDLPPRLYVLGEVESDNKFFTYPHFDSNGTGFVYAWRQLSSLKSWADRQPQNYYYHQVNTHKMIMGLLHNTCTRYLAYNHTPKLADVTELQPTERFVKECLLDMHSFRSVWPTIRHFMETARIDSNNLAAFEKLAAAHRKLKTADMLKHMETVFKKPVAELVRSGDFGILWNSCSQALKESGIPNRIVDIMQQKVRSHSTLPIAKAIKTANTQKTS